MPFKELMRDKISIFDEQGNLVASEQAANVQRGEKILTQSGNFVVDIGYLIERKLPNGHVERYRVIEPNYSAGMHGIPAHYEMNVKNVKNNPTNSNSVVNNITLSGQSSFYQHSTDNSINTYNTYTLHQYKEALEAINDDVAKLDLEQSDRDLIKNSLAKIENELKKPQPDKGFLDACISFLPTSIATLESVLNLSNMLGIS